MEPTPSPLDQQEDQLIEILKTLGSLQTEYPPELLAARRAAFAAQVEREAKQVTRREERHSRKQFTRRLAGLSYIKEEYPADLLAARRAAFVAQVEKVSPVEVKEELTDKDQEIIRLLRNIKSLEPEYAPRPLSARRAAFRRQIARGGAVNPLDAWRASLLTFLDRWKLPVMPSFSPMRVSLTVAVLVVVAFIGSMLFDKQVQQLTPAATEPQIAGPVQGTTASTEEMTAVICKPGYLPPLCLAKEFDNKDDLTYPGNGSARPAVAKDTRPGNGDIHKAAYVNDGLYGPGASWVSNSPNSWIKIDLGKAMTINTVSFGRDRLGNLNDGDPGQFVIAVALSDDIYADGVSTNDYVEYTQVFNSKQVGFDGIVQGAETIQAQFAPVKARYVKITFQNAGTAVDEVEVFMAKPPAQTSAPTHKPKDDVHVLVGPPVPTSLPTDTPPPADTATPVPTDTLVPTDTHVPTDTPVPTDTSTPKPTNTPRPTNTPTPLPTDTMPPPTNTAVPTDTLAPTNVPPPTNTPEPVPTDTAVPQLVSTDTAVPVIP